MASDIMQQVQEDSRKKKQQGVLSRMSDQPDQQGMGTGTRETPEPTVVEKAKEVQEEEVVAEPKIEDPRSMSTSERKLRQEQIAAEAPSHPWYRDEGNFTEKIQRGMDLDEIRGEFRGTQKLRESAVGEDARQYAKQYSRLASENPGMSETDLQDAAIKAVRDIQSEKAAYFASKFDDVDYGEEMEDFALAQMRREQSAAAAKKKEDDQAKAAADTIKRKGRGGTTPKQPTDTERAAQKALGKTTTDEAEETTTDEVEETTTDEVEETTTDEVEETTTPAVSPKQNATVSLLESYSPRQQQAVLQQPGGANFIEALDSLDAASKGDVSALMRFEEAFGDRTVQGGKDMSRRQFLSRIPPMLRESFGDSLRTAVRASEPKVSKGLESQLSRNLYESVSQLKGVPSDEAQAEIDKTAKELQKVFLNHSEIQATGSTTGGIRKRMSLNSVGEAKRAELVNNLMEKIGIRKGLLESLGAAPSLAKPSDVFANNLELRNQVLAFNRASDLLNTSNFIPAAEGTSAPTATRTSGTIPQEALDKYPIYQDVDEDFPGLAVSADYGDHVDIPEGKQFSHTIFPGNYDNLPLEQRYEYVVTTDGTKYLFKANPEDPEWYLDPVEVTEVTELSPSESIIASATEGS
jgi:hypothetical protein